MFDQVSTTVGIKEQDSTEQKQKDNNRGQLTEGKVWVERNAIQRLARVVCRFLNIHAIRIV